MSGEEMQEVEQFNYFGAMISTDGGIGEEIAHWVLGGRGYGGRGQSCRKRK